MKTVFDIRIDFKRSLGSYLFDKTTNSQFLDFFGIFSSLPIGYNHSIFDESFEKKICIISKIRMANNLLQSDELEGFIEKFNNYTFSKYIHLTCTGSLAVEAAIKCAIEYKKVKKPMVLALKKSFHGINCWGFITDRYLGTAKRIEYFPENNWKNLSIDEVKNFLQNNNNDNVVAVVIEPIQCTAGDIYIPKDDLIELYNLCNKKDICFIFDEIQTGFGVTGEMWYYEYLKIIPDILIFGKKSQICGIVANHKYSECITTSVRKLDVTFDGELIDAVRATYILKAYEKENLIHQVNINNKIFAKIIQEKVLNYRSIGHLIAFDFPSEKARNIFANKCYEEKLLVNKAGNKTIRLRPNLAISSNEINDFNQIFDAVIK